MVLSVGILPFAAVDCDLEDGEFEIDIDGLDWDHCGSHWCDDGYYYDDYYYSDYYYDDYYYEPWDWWF